MAAQPADPALVALAAAYQARTAALRASVEQLVRTLWTSLGSYRQAQMAQYVREILPRVLGAQQQMVALTSAFLSHQRQIALQEPFRAIAVDPQQVTGPAARLGADPAQVHARPFHLVWRQLDELPHVDGAIEQAIGAGLERAVDLALDDLQLTKNHTAAAVGAQDDKVRYTRRILEGTHSCGLCIVASTQRYHADELMPIHGGCDCSAQFVWTDEDPGQLLDLELLQDIHDRIEERFGASNPGAREIGGTAGALLYRDVLVTHQHGELGPILAIRGHEFTGPDQI